MQENEKVIGTGKRAPGGVYMNVHKVDGEDRLLAVVEVRGGAYSRIKAIADALPTCDGVPQTGPAGAFEMLMESRLGDLAIGYDEGTRAAIGDVCAELSDTVGVECDAYAVERAVMKSLDA